MSSCQLAEDFLIQRPGKVMVFEGKEGLLLRVPVQEIGSHDPQGQRL